MDPQAVSQEVAVIRGRWTPRRHCCAQQNVKESSKIINCILQSATFRTCEQQMFRDGGGLLQNGLKWNLCLLKKKKKRKAARRWVRGKPFIVSTARSPPTRLPFYQLLPERERRCLEALVGARTPRRNHWPRQPLNEDGLAPLSHCTLAKLSFGDACVRLWLLLPPYVSILRPSWTG